MCVRSGGGYSFLVGYQFILGIASMQRISSDHVGGDIFVDFGPFLKASGLTCWTLSSRSGPLVRARGDMGFVLFAVYLVFG